MGAVRMRADKNITNDIFQDFLSVCNWNKSDQQFNVIQYTHTPVQNLAAQIFLLKFKLILSYKMIIECRLKKKCKNKKQFKKAKKKLESVKHYKQTLKTLDKKSNQYHHQKYNFLSFDNCRLFLEFMYG